jgi:hypothetical protein
MLITEKLSATQPDPEGQVPCICTVPPVEGSEWVLIDNEHPVWEGGTYPAIPGPQVRGLANANPQVAR